MGPGSTVNNPLGVRLHYTKAIRNSLECPLLWVIYSKLANLLDIIVSQPRVGTVFAAHSHRVSAENSKGVKVVFRLCTPLKIVEPVIIAYSILVVGLLTLPPRADKRIEYKDVDLMLSRCTIFPKTNELIAFVVQRLKHPLLVHKLVVVSGATKALDTTAIGNHIQSLVTDNVFPYFAFWSNHVHIL
jgi:hypothetical protein